MIIGLLRRPTHWEHRSAVVDPTEYAERRESAFADGLREQSHRRLDLPELDPGNLDRDGVRGEYA